MARCLGVKAYWVSISKDCRGDLTCHACAGVIIGQKALLADPAYLWFGAPHQEYQCLDDLQVLGIYLSQQGELSKRRAAVQIAPELAITHFNLAESLAKRGHRVEAEKALRAGLRVNSEEWLGFYAQAVLESYDENWQKAAQHLQQCLALNPSYGEAHLLLGAALRAQGG